MGYVQTAVEHAKRAIERGLEFARQDIWTIGAPGEPIPRGFLAKHVRVAMLIGTDVLGGKLTRRAAALSFATLLSVVPFLAIIIFIMQTFNLGEGFYAQTERRIESAVVSVADLFGRETGASEAEPVNPDAETQDPGASEPAPDSASGGQEVEVSSGADVEAAIEDVADQEAENADLEEPAEDADAAKSRLEDQLIRFGIPASTFRGEGKEDPVQWLVDLSNQVVQLAQEAATDPRAVSIAGLVLILTTVLGLMKNIEGSFNSIWGVKRTRSYLRMMTDYVLITLLLPFVAALVLGVTAAMESETVRTALGPLAHGVRFIQFFTIVLVFTALYYFVPNTRVKPVYALLGGVIAGTLWVLLSWGYVNSQTALARYSIFYAGFATFPLLLVWIYFSWTILLLGAEISYAYQNEYTFAMERYAAEASFAYREAIALRTMIEVGKRFENGQPGLDPEEAAREWNVPLRLLNGVLETLVGARLVSRTVDETETYLPRKPLDRIKPAEIIEAVRNSGLEPSQFRADEAFKPFFDELEAQRDLFRGATLEDLIQRVEERASTVKQFPEPDAASST